MSGGFSTCRSVLITGTSRGIGLQMVKDLAKSNEGPDRVFATARKPADAKELQDLARSNSRVHIITLDVNSQTSIDTAVQEVTSLVGNEGLNCLINNAAINITGELETVTADNMMKVFESNAVSPLMVTKAFLPLLRAAATRGSGMGIHRAAVVNMSSGLGSIQLNWGPDFTFMAYTYRTSKAALNMLTRCLARQLEAEGVLCMALHPGWVRTDMGGPTGMLSVEESTSGLLSVITGLSEKDHGQFQNYKGETLPW
ncbi:C-signal-like [Conger conger]|uniref:C-signal-like n=1 Tax=Conger conger TaxID=82655 RepID=UPI002A5A34B1|nr:C-signal-like [Conger conger]